jgi:hypothetical protein
VFRDLAVAGRAVASYPSGHPSTGAGLARAHASVTALLALAGPVELGAARDAILWEDRRFTSPPAALLAKLLRRRRAAGLLLDPGVTAGELETLLRALAIDTRTAGEAGSFSAELTAAGLVHVRVSDLDFSSLSLVDGDEESTAPEAGALPDRVLRHLLASGAIPASAMSAWVGSGRSGADLLQLLFETGGDTAAATGWGPAALVAALQEAAGELCDSPDADRAAAVAAIHARLRAGDRRRLLEELAAAAVSHGTAAETLALLAASLPAAAASRLRQAIEVVAARGRGEGAVADPLAEAIQPERLATLRRAFATHDVDTFRDVEMPPSALASLLDLPDDPVDPPLSPAAEKTRRELGDPALERDPSGALLDLAERAEVPPGALPPILRRFEAGHRRLLSGGRLQQALALLERVQGRAAGAGVAAAAFRESFGKLSGSESVEALVASIAEIPEDGLAGVRTLVQHMDPGAVGHLLDILARTENRRMRFRLLDLLSKLGPVVARDAEALLSDPRWYVVRNMLLLLRRVGDAHSVPAVRRCVDHPDLRVRLEAIHNLFAFDRAAPSQLLRTALHDADLRQAEAAMELAGKYGITEAIDPIVEYLCSRDPFGRRRAVRLKAIRALAAIGDPRALEGLGRFRARFRLFPPAVEERRELYRTLPAYPEESYGAWIESGLRSRDAEIRRLSAAMGPGPGGEP